MVGLGVGFDVVGLEVVGLDVMGLDEVGFDVVGLEVIGLEDGEVVGSTFQFRLAQPDRSKAMIGELVGSDELGPFVGLSDEGRGVGLSVVGASLGLDEGALVPTVVGSLVEGSFVCAGSNEDVEYSNEVCTGPGDGADVLVAEKREDGMSFPPLSESTSSLNRLGGEVDAT